MRVSAAPFVGMPAVVRLRRLMFVMPGLEAGISVTPPKPMTFNSKSEGRDFVYVGADDTIFVPPVSVCPIAIPMKRTVAILDEAD
jgi:hypothetical protein